MSKDPRSLSSPASRRKITKRSQTGAATSPTPVGIEPAHPRPAAVAFVLVTVALDMLALGIVLPVLPRLVVEFTHGDVGAGAGWVGLFGFGWAVMQFFFTPVLGALSDRFGRRPVIILSNLGLGLDYLLMALAPSLAWLFVGRLISGVTAATFSSASSYITDVTPPERRAAKFGLLAAAFGLGFILGPAIGGLLGAVGLRLPFWGAAVFSLANAAYGSFVLPESLSPARRTRYRWRQANPLGSVALLAAAPDLLGLVATAWLQRLAHAALPSMFVLYAEYRYGWSTATVGYALTVVGLSSMIVSGLLVGPTVKRLGERRTLLLGSTFMMAGFTGFGVAPSGAWLWVALPVLALGGFASPALQGLATRRVGPSDQGKLQGAFASLGSLADMVGPLVATQAFALAIMADGPIYLPGAPFLLAGLLAATALAFAWRVPSTP
jgi:DHA1 family tetracycline resistance protein-like MFS transporter